MSPSQPGGSSKRAKLMGSSPETKRNCCWEREKKYNKPNFLLSPPRFFNYHLQTIFCPSSTTTTTSSLQQFKSTDTPQVKMPDKASSSSGSGSGSGAGDYTYKSSGTNSQVRRSLRCYVTDHIMDSHFRGIIFSCSRATTIALVTTAPARQTRIRTTIRIRELNTYMTCPDPSAWGLHILVRASQRRYSSLMSSSQQWVILLQQLERQHLLQQRQRLHIHSSRRTEVKNMYVDR
jgi:hypothetical protein